MALKQAATRIDAEQYELFKATTRQLGTTPSDAIRMFIYSFNDCGGFPYEVRTTRPETERDATRFATALSLGVLDEAR